MDRLQLLYDNTGDPYYLERKAEKLDRKAGLKDDENTDLRMLEQVFDIRQYLWRASGDLDMRVRRENLRERLHKLYEMFPEKKIPWIMLHADSESALAEMKEYLQQSGYRIAFTSTGYSDVYNICPEIEPDLIISDMNRNSRSVLHDMDFLLRVLRVKVKVLLTGCSDVLDSMKEGLRMGASAYLISPFTMEELGEKVREVLAQE